MARFMGLVMHLGPVIGDVPGPDPATFGFPTDDDGSRDDPLMANIRGGGVMQPPALEALRTGPTRIVVAVGEESGGPDDGSVAGRAAHAPRARAGHRGRGVPRRPRRLPRRRVRSGRQARRVRRPPQRGARRPSERRPADPIAQQGGLALQHPRLRTAHLAAVVALRTAELAAVRAPHRRAARGTALLPDGALDLGEALRRERAPVAVADRPGRIRARSRPRGTCPRTRRSRRR